MKPNKQLYVHYGCGTHAPDNWTNFDISPTLRLQKIPVLGKVVSTLKGLRFPKNIHYGDIVKGLPVAENSATGVYCSHTLEHLSLADFRKALRNTYKMMVPGGTFRCLVPDLEYQTRMYLEGLANGDPEASIMFMKKSLLGAETRPRGFKSLAVFMFGNAEHLWMWDRVSLTAQLREAGFVDVRQCSFGDAADPMFRDVEERRRYEHAVALECKKPD